MEGINPVAGGPTPSQQVALKDLLQEVERRLSPEGQRVWQLLRQDRERGLQRLAVQLEDEQRECWARGAAAARHG